MIFKSTAHRSIWEITSITFHHCVAVDWQSVTVRCGGKMSERNESFGTTLFSSSHLNPFKANASWDFRQAFCTLCLFACWLISRTSFHFKAFQLKYYQRPRSQNLTSMEKKLNNNNKNNGSEDISPWISSFQFAFKSNLVWFTFSWSPGLAQGSLITLSGPI